MPFIGSCPHILFKSINWSFFKVYYYWTKRSCSFRIQRISFSALRPCPEYSVWKWNPLYPIRCRWKLYGIR